MRLSKICLFEAVQKPLASYRSHDKNLSKLNKRKEIEESEIWLRENKLNLNEFQIKNLQKKVDNMKFVNYKIKGKYKDCISMLLDPKKNMLNIKNLILFFVPSILLRKLLWFS